MVKQTRIVSNLFGDSNGQGAVIGVSDTWFGNGSVEIVNLDNPGNVLVQMQRREHAIESASWVNVGDPVTASVQVANLFSSGYEYRAQQLENSVGNPLRLTVRGLTQSAKDVLVDVLRQNIAEGFLVGFAASKANALIQYGDFEALRAGTAVIFICYDPDPDLNAEFGGPWFKFGVDYVSLHPNQVQLTLSTAIANYINNGGTTSGGTTNTGTTTAAAGTVGGVPLVQTGLATLESPADFTVSVYSSVNAQAFWPDVSDVNAADVWELSLNGVVIFVGDYTANTRNMVNLSPDTSYALSLVRYQEQGNGTVLYADPVTATFETPEEGTSVGAGTDNNDGAPTDLPFYVFDAGDFSYLEAGAGSPSQAWSLTTGNGATGVGSIRTAGIDSVVSSGARSVYTNREVSSSDRRIRVRCKADIPGSQFAIASHGQGILSVVTVNNTDWDWVDVPNLWAANDSSLQVYGITLGVDVDKIIAQDEDDLVVPTGEQGLYAV